MKITKKQLKRIIKEELGRIMEAGTWEETATPIEGPLSIPTIVGKIIEIIESNPGVAIGYVGLSRWLFNKHSVGDEHVQSFEYNIDRALESRDVAEYYDKSTHSFTFRG